MINSSDKMLMKEVKQKKKNLAMAWVDYKKVYDMVPHSWIAEFKYFWNC